MSVRSIRQEREGVYGHPKINHERIAAIWAVVLGIPITPKQVCLCMIGTKMARLVQTPDHQDSIDDIEGYVECIRAIDEADKQ